MQLSEQCAELFDECFPMAFPAARIIAEKLEGAVISTRYENDRLIGFSAIDGDSLLLLCVHPDHQGKGIGSLLLDEAEKQVKSSGSDRLILGRSDRDIFWGAVIDTMSHRFFEKKGYSAANGCLSMYLAAEDFSFENFIKEHPVPENVKFVITREEASPELLEAVNLVEPKWVSHYRNRSDVFVVRAELSGRTVGFVMADTEARTIVTGEDCRTGLLGYVGVVPEERCKGIGLCMVARAIDHMISEGCTELFVNYTSLDGWYAKLGFEEYLWYWMGEKSFY